MFDTPEEIQKQKTRTTFLSLSSLKSRGWTAGLVTKFLKHPDSVKPNPMFKSAAPMKLYLLERIETVENSPEFAAESEKIASRKRGAKKAVETKRGKTREMVEKMLASVSVEKLPPEKLLKRAKRHYDDIQTERAMRYGWDRKFEDFEIERAENWKDDDKLFIDPEVPETKEENGSTVEYRAGFLRRIAVNYLRHQGSEYERYLEKTFGKVGVDEAYVEIKLKVLETIAAEYPFLGNAVKRAVERMRSETRDTGNTGNTEN